LSLRVLPTNDLEACLEIRRIVFVEEQGVPLVDDIDGLDGAALHILATVEGQPAETARVIRKGSTAKIGRVAVLPQFRGQGIGAALVTAAIEQLSQAGDVDRVVLGAQTHAAAFYERLGFSASGPEYMDAGIPHRDMVRVL
jgi:ElaA protein